MLILELYVVVQVCMLSCIFVTALAMSACLHQCRLANYTGCLFLAGLTLLLSLRFMSLVFEELRNLALGLAARGVQWNSLGPTGALGILARLGGRLFANLMQRSSSIAEAMCVRGFVGPQDHQLYLTKTEPSNILMNVAAVLLLGILGVGVKYL